MESQDSGRLATTLADRFENSTDAGHIADTIVSIWQAIDAALSPIIGQRGVVALYKRSLHLTARVHPWLAGTYDGMQTTIHLAPLQAVLAQQNSTDAAAGGDAHLQTFHELLATLVGPSLTERLLRSVWANSSRRPPVQDALL